MRLRFTIRDLLWLTASIAIGLGWWIEHRSIVREREQLVHEREDLAIEREDVKLKGEKLTEQRYKVAADWAALRNPAPAPPTQIPFQDSGPFGETDQQAEKSRVTVTPKASQRSINRAVRQALQRCLDFDSPLPMLKPFLDRLRASGEWSDEDIEIVKNTATQMLSVIYDMDSAEGRAQDEDR